MSITATNIKKTFGTYTALEGVDLNVPAGKLVALLGPSGSGKTTLLRIIAGLEFADEGSGHIAFHGEDVTQVPAGKRGVGFVFQHYALFRHMTVAENVAFGLNVRKRKDRPAKDEIADRVNKLLKLVQLDNLGPRLPTQLSGGQRQRVALARALAVEPKVLLLDEPFGALDAKVRKELRRWLRHFHDEINLTTVFVTHDQEEALEIADEVVVMNNAKVEQVGTPQDVYDHPASPFVYNFLGNVNRLQLPWRGLHDTGSAAPFSDAQVAYVRPHELEILHYRVGLEGEVATVESIHAAGAVARVTTRRGASEFVDVELSRARLDELALRPDDSVLLRVRRSRLFAEDYSI
ncbi:MAG: sulfate transporter [Rariglobus sp.]|jgi:sulfate transport system ATP-binding protein|nr:sulfate transporter [Rariglobus sp.]